MNLKIEKLKQKAKYLRQQVLEMCVSAGTGHVTSCFSCVEIMTALYYGGILKFDPKNPKWEERDRFVLSKGHASPLLYVILADLGFFPKEYLKKFTQADGKFSVHLQHDVPGAEITSGSLGHGFGVAAGMALAGKLNRRLYTVFTLLGDGECYEGSIWETAMFASHNRLNNLIAIIDRNYLSTIDFTENALALEPLEEKWKSFGWRTISINGHSFEEIFKALEGFRSRRSSQPLVIIANTVKGKGIEFMSDVPLWHALAPQGQQAIDAKKELEKENDYE
jgi:transketolase